MKDIITYLIIIVALGILRTALPKLKTVKTAFINRTVKAVEKKIKGSGRGAEKKARAIKRLKWLGVKADETTSNMIDLAVEAMNTRNATVKSSLKTAVSDKVESGVEAAGTSLKAKLSGDDGGEEEI